MPEFYVIFARKNARILHDNEKYFSDYFFFGGWHVPRTPSPVSYAYAHIDTRTNTHT